MMKTAGILPAILLALAVTDQPQKTARPRDATEETLLANERALHAAVAKADRAAFTSLVLPEGVWANSQGFVPLNLLANGLDGFRATKVDIVNPHVTRLDESSAIVIYSWIGTGTSQDRPLPQTTIASTVWTRRDGKWLAAHHQETELITNPDHFSRTITNEPGRAAGRTTHPEFRVALQPSPRRVVPSSGPVAGTDSVAPSAARKTPPSALRRPH